MSTYVGKEYCDIFVLSNFSVTAKHDDVNCSFYLFPQHASVTRPVHTAVVSIVIRTVASVPADMVSEEGSAISVQLVTMVFLIVSVSVVSVCVSVCKPDQISTVCLFSTCMVNLLL